MTEWITKNNEYVPLPPQHILRLGGVDFLLDCESHWCVAYILAGKTVEYAKKMGFSNACCAIKDWPDELGPLPKKPEFIVKAGKRYWKRDGKISGIIEQTKSDNSYYTTHPFFDPVTRITYKESGLSSTQQIKYSDDLIAEYYEPKNTTTAQQIEPIVSNQQTGFVAWLYKTLEKWAS